LVEHVDEVVAPEVVAADKRAAGVVRAGAGNGRRAGNDIHGLAHVSSLEAGTRPRSRSRSR
jgi:hypothetical protein